MKLLFIDIETTPNLADVWQLWNQNISLSQLRESSRMLCFAASWFGSDDILWFREYENDREMMVSTAWDLLHEADCVCHFNGKRFDIPTLNKEFLLLDYDPPSPYQQIDLYQVVKRMFRFPSNRLEYISRVLGTSGKIKNSGHELWVRCMRGDLEAWAEMEEYNRQDVQVLKEVYPRVLPWISGHPSVPLYDTASDVNRCARCGGEMLVKQGYAFTATGKFQRYKCSDCGGWSQDTKRLDYVALRTVT